MNVRSLRSALTFACIIGSTLLTSVSRAQLVIVPTFDSSITSDPNSAQIIAAINADVAFYQATYTNKATVKITFKEDQNIGLGGSSTFGGDVSYSAYYNKIVANATAAGDAAALRAYLLIAPVNGNNPVNGVSTIHITTALDRAIGTNFFNYSGTDSTISLKTSIMNLTRPNTNSSKYDLQTVVYHEINEALGFTSALDGLANGAAAPTGAIQPADLYRYNATGTRSFSTVASAVSYFSVDGVTHLERFNQTQGGDFHDWYSDGSNGARTFAASPQDAFLLPNIAPDNGASEMTALEVLGYTPKSAALATVTGRISLEGVANLAAISSYAPLGTFHLSFRAPGTTTEIKGFNAALTPTAGSAYGKYTVSVAPGVYDVRIEGGKNLAVLVSNVTIAGTTGAVPDVRLSAGDANGDNSVDSTDFGILIGAFGSDASVPGSGYAASADFNFDGLVDSTDFSLLIGEFNNSGAN